MVRPSSLNTLVENCWKNKPYQEALPCFTANTSDWSKKKNFGDIFLKKKILAYLEGIQNFSNFPHSPFLRHIECNLRKDFNDILKLEEDYWKLRSRIS